MDDVVWLKTDPSMFKSKWSTVSFFLFIGLLLHGETSPFYRNEYRTRLAFKIYIDGIWI